LVAGVVSVMSAGLVLLLPAIVLAVVERDVTEGWLLPVAGWLCYTVAGFCIAASTRRDSAGQVGYLALILPGMVFVMLVLIRVVPLLVAENATPGLSDATGVWQLLSGELYVETLRAALGGGSVIVGGLLHHVLLVWARSRHPPATWEYQTRQGHLIAVADPQEMPALVTCYRVLGALFLVASLLGCLCILPLVGGFVLHGMFRQLALRHTVKSAHGDLQLDDRAPVIYLRCFQDGTHHPKDSWQSRFNSSLAALLGPTPEQRLANVVRSSGPLVAIRLPGEELPPMDAGRIHVSDHDCRDIVIDLLSRPGATLILQAGGTTKLRWGLEALGVLLRPDQVIVFLPFAAGDAVEVVEEQYRAFRSWAARCLPRASLPPTLNHRAPFLVFDRQWRSYQVTPNQILPDRHPRLDVLKSVQGDSGFQYQYPFLLARDWWKPAVLVVLLLILGWVYLLNVRILADSHYGAEMARRNATMARQAAIPPEPVDYEGKAVRYRIHLAPGWKPEVTESPGVDRCFTLGSDTHLHICIDPQPIDLQAFGRLFLDRIFAKGVKPTLLRRQAFSRQGYEGLDLEMKLESASETAYMYIRIWCGKRRSFRLMAATEGPQQHHRKDVLEAFDGFEFPAPR
jgi:hypothetical protein